MIHLQSYVCGRWEAGTGEPVPLHDPATEAVLGVLHAIRHGHVRADQVVLTGPEAMVRGANRMRIHEHVRLFESHGFTLLTNTFWSFYYTACGLHALHVIAGCIIMLFVAASARKGQDLHRVELVGIYWHFVDIVWIFLFPLLYLLGRHLPHA